MLSHTYTQMELEFARLYPEEVPNQHFLKAVAEFFVHDETNIDWAQVEYQLYNNFKMFFDYTDFAQFSQPDDMYLFIEAKDEKTGIHLGFIQFLISNEFEFGHVRACYFCMDPAWENRGIEKALMASIFKIAPNTTRIFLHTRSTNQKHIREFESWGFSEFAEGIPGWPDFEYWAQEQDTLQQLAANTQN